MKKKPEEKIGRPSLLHTAFEGVRAGRDITLMLATKPLRGMLPQGDGHPVLVLPGFLSNDGPTWPLRAFLDDIGYEAEAWNGSVNWGPSEQTLQHLKDRLKEVYDKHGGQKVSLVGWSLGGIYARELAREFPDVVRGVISLGSPHHAAKHATDAPIEKLFKFINPDIDPAALLIDDPDVPIEPPMTSIYTEADGVVHWKTCILKECPKTENIEVDSSHTGIIFSPQTLTVIADRLSQPEDGPWKKFNTWDYPLAWIKDDKQQVHRSKKFGHG